MLGIVLGTRLSRPTASVLATLLRADYSENYLPNYPEYQYMFRYGNSYTTSHSAYYRNNNCIEFNEARVIQITSNKPQCRRLLLERGVHCPKLYGIETNFDDINYPIIARPYFHSRGKKFYLVDNPKDANSYLRNGFYLQECIKKEKEYRIFMWKGKFFECNTKETTTNTKNMLIRNHLNGWIFKKILFRNLPPLIQEECRRTYRATGLDWMAIDCCIDTQERPIIFEVNSAPGLVERKILMLSDKIMQWLYDRNRGGDVDQ